MPWRNLRVFRSKRLPRDAIFAESPMFTGSPRRILTFPAGEKRICVREKTVLFSSKRGRKSIGPGFGFEVFVPGRQDASA